MICPYCEEKQYQTQKSKGKIGMLTPIILLPLIIQVFFDVPGAITIISFPILFILVIVLYPFLMKLSSEEKYIF